MKITSSRRDDIIKERDAYDSDYKTKLNQRDKEWAEYRKAEYGVMNPISEEIKSMLSQFDTLEFDVEVDRGWGDGLRCRIQCNENTKFDDDSALSWSYSATIGRDGEVKKESSSWSGLKATTPEQMNSLIQTVEALKVINNINWATKLGVTLPEPSEFVQTEMPNAADRPDFENQLIAEDLRDMIGQAKFVADRDTSFGYAVKSEGDKTFTLYKIPIHAFYSGTYSTAEELYDAVLSSCPTVRVNKTDLVDKFGKELSYLYIYKEA